MEEGLIMRSTGSWYEIRCQDGRILNGRLKGKFKLENKNISNPIAVGDRVRFTIEDQQHETLIIEEILPRDNYIIRKSVHKTGQGQILAANIDQLLFVYSHKFPETSLGFLDRMLVTAEAFRIPVTILFNKMDLLEEDETQEVSRLADLYESLGYDYILTSAGENWGLDQVEKVILGKVSLLAGHSGVGKSSLMNKFNPNLKIKTQEISDFAQKGKHTTTYATMWELKKNSFIIDSPGIKELGILEIEEAELSHYFPEFRELMGECKFNNCRHLEEPKCAVVEALNQGKIAESRYLSYLSILENDDNRR